jgi:hypothetical protein
MIIKLKHIPDPDLDLDNIGNDICIFSNFISFIQFSDFDVFYQS